MSGRIKDEDVAYIREHAPIDEIVGDYVQLKSAGGGQKIKPSGETAAGNLFGRKTFGPQNLRPPGTVG